MPADYEQITRRSQQDPWSHTIGQQYPGSHRRRHHLFQGPASPKGSRRRHTQRKQEPTCPNRYQRLKNRSSPGFHLRKRIYRGALKSRIQCLVQNRSPPPSHADTLGHYYRQRHRWSGQGRGCMECKGCAGTRSSAAVCSGTRSLRTRRQKSHQGINPLRSLC
ncbi:hypothetical protein ARMSODRAFT_1087290 [Armillaria solidipes]|uniref:Uncharacterized protein n=1 Tax=Armillaria solidipes TaxID=1076256 RepID=A0A2H3B9W1_9AGAR|nr:hypothetical protein ARMSODRAFT_1087290 [Armillaria solidipes]